MRTLLVLPLVAAALLVLPLAAADETMAYACHSYEVYVGTNEQGAGASTDDGAVALAALGHYVVYDGPLWHGYLYSFGLGTEQNGVQGYQRGEDICDETNGGQVEPDCFISCTF